MSNFPNNLDDDTTLPFVNDNITEIGGEAINALRDAVFAIEQNIGLGAQGTTSSIAARFGVSFFPDGSLKPSAITSLGLVTLPITEDQIADFAQIPESKLRLDHRTQDLFNYIRDLSGDINLAIGWISVTGIKLEPHLIGAIYRHALDQIDVSTVASDFMFNNLRLLRNNSDSFELVNDINNELLAHQWADGSPFGFIKNITTNNGSVYPNNYGHTASGIFINTSRFATIPQTADDLQLFAEFIDSSSLFLLGTRIQNLYSNGISRASRSSNLSLDGYGQGIVPDTHAIAYLKNIGNNSGPFDSIDTGDDIIEFKPSTTDSTNNSFDAKFALVKVGDIIRVNYGTVEVGFVIKEKKYSQSGGNKKYVVRIAGKNLFYAPNATARIDRPLFNTNKYGVLAIAPVNNNFSALGTLIVSDPRGGEALGVGFSPDQFNESHYLLYLALYPTGFPQDGYTILPPVDVTGNQGTTPGLYTLDSVVEATNNAFRQNGYNYRFIAFSYQGEFGIMLADPYNNASFSILSAMVAPNGVYDQTGTLSTFPSNVVDVFPTVGTVAPDPLGFGPFGANIASPPFMLTYGSPEASQNPTKLFVPLRRNNFYTNGIERDRMTLEVGQALDGYGDGYWVAQVIDQQVPSGRVQTTYRIPLDLSTSNLKIGKTVVIQSLGAGSLVDFGRFIIQDVTFGCTPSEFTDITVYDAVHAKGFSPTTTIALDAYVSLYFNSDSVAFNTETATDFTQVTPFKRHFEIYVDQNSGTFTHERGRILLTGASISINGVTLYSNNELAKLDIVKISPKLRGYLFGSVTKIALSMNYDSGTGIFTGFLGSYDGVSVTRQSASVTGKKGEITRFYDETGIDYIDIIFDVNTSVSTVSNGIIEFQLFPTLSLDDEVMLIGTCQVNDTTKRVNKVRDERQFGNTSEKELSTSALDFIAYPERVLHFNGVVRGLDITNITNEFITLRGGVVLVNGKFQSINNQVFVMPKVKESYFFTFYPINWLLCVNSIGELVVIPMSDFDSTLGTPNDPTRLFTAFNVVTSTTYNIDSTTFSNLIDNTKTLTVLYIISSTVTGTGTGATVSLTSRDVRRYINDQDSCMPAIANAVNNASGIATNSPQGNFKNGDSAFNWIRYNNALQNTLIFKGVGKLTAPFNFTTGQLNIYPQGAGTTLAFTGSGTVNFSNFRFTDIPISIPFATTASSSSFHNSPLTVGNSATLTSVNLAKCGATVFSGSLTTNNTNFADGTVSIGPTGTLTSSTFTNCPITVAGGPATTLTNVTLNRSPITVGSSSGTTLFTTTSVTESNITVSGSGGFESDGCPISNSLISVGGNAYLGVFATASGNIGTTLTDCILSATTVTAPGTLFNRTNVTASGGASTLVARFVDSNLILTGLSSNLVTDTTNFTNSTITVTGTANLAGGRFIGCNITINSTSTVLGAIFEDCTVVFTGAAQVTNTSFRNCNLTFTNGGTLDNVIIDPSTVTIGATITLNPNVTIWDSTITVSAVRAFTLNNNFKFERNNVTWTGTPVSGYNATDIVNSGNGFMWATIGASTLHDISVRDNTFNTALQDHFPFFAIQMTSYSAVLSKVNVIRNNFTSTAPADDIRAVIAVVSTLTARAPVGTYPPFPYTIDVHFDFNTCNYDQLIIVTGARDATLGSMNGAAPVTVNTTISHNICGTIGYFTGSPGPFDGSNAGSPNQGIIRDKSPKLIIDNNYCKFIANLDSIGDYICGRCTNFPSGHNVFEEVASTVGETTITNNTCNWIQVVAGGYTVGQSGVEIRGNTVSPFNPSFLNNFTSSTILQSVTPGNVGIILRREHNAQGGSSSLIISNQIVQKYTTSANAGVSISAASNGTPIQITTSTPHGFVNGQLVAISGVTGNACANGTWYISNVTTNTFTLDGSSGSSCAAYAGGGIAVASTVYYYDAGMAVFNHAKIEGNTIAGVVNSATAPLMYFWDINSQIVTGNVLERRGLTCNAYIYADGLSGPGTAAQRLTVIANQYDALDSGSGTTNRTYISYGTGTTVLNTQNGWLSIHNVAGNQASGFTTY